MKLRALFFLFLCFFSSVFSFDADAATRVERVLNVGGVEREYIAHIPENVPSNVTLPVIVVFHPAIATAKGMEGITKLHDAPSASKYIVVYPNGHKRTWNVGYCCGKAKQDNVNDIAFYRAILKDLKTIHDIEPRVYLTGFSNGALLSYHLMCHATDSVAAIAPFGATYNVNEMACPLKQPVPVMHFHGSLDEMAPVHGGTKKTLGGQTLRHYSAQEVIEYMVKNNQCRGEKTTTKFMSACEHHYNCNQGAEVMFCLIDGLGHVWPGNDVGLIGGWVFGEERPEINGSEDVLKFFDYIRALTK